MVHLTLNCLHQFKESYSADCILSTDWHITSCSAKHVLYTPPLQLMRQKAGVVNANSPHFEGKDMDLTIHLNQIEWLDWIQRLSYADLLHSKCTIKEIFQMQIKGCLPFTDSPDQSEWSTALFAKTGQSIFHDCGTRHIHCLDLYSVFAYSLACNSIKMFHISLN